MKAISRPVTVVAPLCRLSALIYVPVRSHEAVPPHHLRRLFAITEQLRPWSMMEVFVFGVFVAYVKLTNPSGKYVTQQLSSAQWQWGTGRKRYYVFAVRVSNDLVTIGLATGVYALMALTFVLVWIDSTLDREAVWERLDRRSTLTPPTSGALVSCEVCGLVGTPDHHASHCPRCDVVLH